MQHESRYTVVRADEQERQRRPSGSVALEGKDIGSDVSLFIITYEGSSGPPLHKHPYAETWVLRGGRARFTVDGEEIEATDGDVVVVRKETPHKFKNLGPGPLDIICIHPSPVFIQENLE